MRRCHVTEEQGQIIKSLGPFIDRRMNERGVRVARQQFTSAGELQVGAAQAIRGRMSMGTGCSCATRPG